MCYDLCQSEWIVCEGQRGNNGYHKIKTREGTQNKKENGMNYFNIFLKKEV